MSKQLTDDQELLLLSVARLGPSANWYKLARLVIGQLKEPDALNRNLRSLLDRGLVLERDSEQPLPKLEITGEGRAFIETLRGDSES